MYTLSACQVCGESDRTIVAEYNRLIFIESMWQSDMARFDYALCHGCGLVYATRRPERAEYDFLYDHFNEFLLRRDNPNSMSVPEVTPQAAADIDAQFVPWWEVRGVPSQGKRIRKALRRDLENAMAYLPYIMLHVPLEGAKALHIRAKGSTLADVMKRMLGASQVDLITLFPTHTYIAQKNEGIRAHSCLDYEDFRIPFDDRYNLIIENHILIHMLDPNRTFDVFRSHMESGGTLFLQKELDDTRLFKKRKNIFAELRPFHYQQFDTPTLERMLRRYGFEPVFLTSKDDVEPELFGIARMEHEPGSCPRIGADELRTRLDMYTRWRDESILSLPKERCHALYGAEIDQIWKRAKARGSLKTTLAGTPAGLRPFGEADTPLADLEIAPSIGGGRAAAARYVADGLRGTRVASWLASALRGTRGGEWIKYRVLGAQSPKKAKRAARSKAS